MFGRTPIISSNNHSTRRSAQTKILNLRNEDLVYVSHQRPSKILAENEENTEWVETKEDEC